MRFKLDENLGFRTGSLIREAGHEVETVAEEKLSGADDRDLFARCSAEARCLITLDLDFSDALRFPPHGTSGIAVLRPRQRVSLAALESLVRNLLALLEREPIAGRLWVVEPRRIRIREGPDE